jgi:two-component system, cell cycle sensor histidine kinase and response regulator CckA
MDASALKILSTTTRLELGAESLRESDFQTAFDAAPIAMAICGLDGGIVAANAALARLLGYEREEVIGIIPWELSAGAQLVGSESSGSQMEDASACAPEKASHKAIAELLRSQRGSFVVEMHLPRRNAPPFWCRLSAAFAGEDRGQPGFLVVVLENASDYRQMEERLRQAEKMEVIGRLAGGVAHDFNNLLTGILLYSDLLLADLNPRSIYHRYIKEVRLACEQGAALTQQLLSGARKSSTERKPAGINEAISETENLLRRLIGERIEVATVLDPAASGLAIDVGRLRQIILNLALNARDALGGDKAVGGKIRISTRMLEAPANGSSGIHQATCVLAVEDNGCGMSAETRGHLFEPSFTTKKDGEGTGLGLGTVHRIVDELGGKIEIASAPGSGTRVEVSLPAARESKTAPFSQDATIRNDADAQNSNNTQALPPA